jgi:branched-chain amino acid transport system permease protein
LTDFLQTTINFLAVGGLYALIALGYTLVYGILRFINFAHSDIVAWSSWIAFTIAGAFGWAVTSGQPEVVPFFALPVVLLLTMMVCAAMGVTIERLAYRPLRKAPRLNVLITAIGVSLFLQNTGQQKWVFGDRIAGIASLLDNQALTTIADVPIRPLDAVAIILPILLVIGLERIVYGTRMGRAMRAVSFDERNAALMGINVNMVVTVTFAIGSALAAAGGILYALRNDVPQTAAFSWVLLGLKAFVAAVVGGIGYVRGAFAGAALIAFVEVFLHRYLIKWFPDKVWVGQLQDVYVFAILIVVLLFRPSGLFGKATVEKV